jgi:hypothetical protein
LSLPLEPSYDILPNFPCIGEQKSIESPSLLFRKVNGIENSWILCEVALFGLAPNPTSAKNGVLTLVSLNPVISTRSQFDAISEVPGVKDAAEMLEQEIKVLDDN